MKQTNSGPIILIIGTRPEAIKMIPVYRALLDEGFKPLICSTLQHDELLNEVFHVFGITPDIDLRVMRVGQDLFYLTQVILQKTKEVFLRVKPSLVMVHGDTTSTMAAALSAFYLDIPVAHVEAGLRTDDIRTPFPEEMNRRMVGQLATYHFAPTSLPVAHLLAQGTHHHNIFCTGNTVVDALRMIRQDINDKKLIVRDDIKKRVESAQKENKKIMLLTVHRRESFDGGIERVLETVKTFLTEHPDVVCIYPFHPNPNVLRALQTVGLAQLDNALLTEPLPYTDLVYLLNEVSFVATDSGGIQEEAISLGKQVLVLREKTERVEGVWAGFAHLVGTQKDAIMQALKECVTQDLQARVTEQTVYGDGFAAQKIARIIAQRFDKTVQPAKSTYVEKKDIVPAKKEDGNMKNVSVLGLGYIGLPTAIITADSGWRVQGYDVNQERVDAINRGEAVIQEPELFERLQPVLQTGHFSASTTLKAADYFIIAVPTPFKDEHKADLSYVDAAASSIASVLKKGDVVILESTVPVGTTQRLADDLAQKTKLIAGTDFYVAHCPERVLPGKIFQELVENDRIIGGINKESVQKAAELYKQFVRGKLYLTSDKSAEMVKLIENSSRDAQIAFAHQVASMAEKAGLNAYEIIELANKHPRVNILKPTCGVGGHCLAVDPWFLIETFPEQTAFLHAARTINDERPRAVLQQIEDAVTAWTQKHERRCTVLVLGATYKADVDDLRESPALSIAQELKKRVTHDTLICEPMVSAQKVKELFGDTAVSMSDGVAQADIIIFLVGHTRFKAIDRTVLAHKTVLDFCGMLHTSLKALGAQEQLYWPASSMLDFYMVNGKDDTQAVEDEIKERLV